MIRDLGCLVAATEVDHVIPIAQGGTDDPNNLQSTCSACHRRKTQHEAAASRKK